MRSAAAWRALFHRRMPRNPHPKSIEEFERDEELYGPTSAQERRRILLELNHDHLDSAWEHIERSQKLLQRIDHTPPSPTFGQPG
jgi:hypothetical protein